MKQSRFSRLVKKWHDLEHGTYLLFQSLGKGRKNLVIILLLIMAVSSLVLISRMRSMILVTRPIPGGTWKEGLVGSPRFINPVLAVSNVDKDLTTIIHAGLVRRLPDGTYAGDLAESYTVDNSGLTYTFVLREDAEFHDSKRVTADDVIYTIDRIKDPLEKSPRNIEWQGVTAKAVDERTITLTLKQPFADFLDIATVGILPKHVYGKYTTDSFSQAKENLEAVGAGPYQVKKVTTRKGIPRSITLERADRGRDAGYIKKIVFNFYESESDAISALLSGSIDHLGSVSAKQAADLERRGYAVTLASFPRLYGMFFNPKQSTILAQPRVTEVIASSIDKEAIINSVLDGFGSPVDAPLPAGLANRLNDPYQPVDVESTLTKAGWTRGEDGIWQKTLSIVAPGSKKTESRTEKLAFTITTSDTPELRKGAEEIAASLQNHGILASVASFDATTLEEKIRTRSYEALYYGIQISRESQVYAFWHSSQRTHPGLNISEYASSRADASLEALQKETDENERLSLWRRFIAAFYSDVPAVFIYSPSYIYVHRNSLPFQMTENIHTASDRYNNIKSWYLRTERVLPFFYKENTNNL